MIDVALDEDTEPIVMGLIGPVERNLRALNTLHRVPADRFVSNRDEAREIAEKILAA